MPGESIITIPADLSVLVRSGAYGETILARVKPERRPAERRGNQIAARVNGAVGSRP